MRRFFTIFFVFSFFVVSGKGTLNTYSSYTLAQPYKEADGGGYTLKRNAPEDLPNFSIVAYPLKLQWGAYGSSAYSYGGELAYNIIPYFSVFGNGFWGTGRGTLAHGDGSNLKQYHEYNAGGTLYLSNKTKTVTERVSAWYKKGFKLKAWYVDVPMKEITKFGFEGGWYSSTSTVNGKNSNIAGYEVNDPTKTRYALNMKGNLASLSSTCYFVGIHTTTLKDYLVSFSREDLEDEDLRGTFDFYFDLLFPVSASYTNVKVTDVSEAPVGTYDLNTYTGKRRTGFRTGFMLAVAKAPGFCYGFEVGDQPAVTKKSFYVGFKLGVGWHY